MDQSCPRLSPFQTFRRDHKELGWVLRRRKGLFSSALKYLLVFRSNWSPVNPFSKVMEYKPTDIQRRAKQERYVQEALAPHLLILRFIRQNLKPCGDLDTQTTLAITSLTMASLSASRDARRIIFVFPLMVVRIHWLGRDVSN